jgi:hypothetical protein
VEKDKVNGDEVEEKHKHHHHHHHHEFRQLEEDEVKKLKAESNI